MNSKMELLLLFFLKDWRLGPCLPFSAHEASDLLSFCGGFQLVVLKERINLNIKNLMFIVHGF